MSDDREAPGAWGRFWFAPVPTTSLTALRILCGLLFSIWLLSFLGHQEELFSLRGWLDVRGVREAQKQPDGLPAPIDWSLLYLPVGADGAVLGDSPAAFQAFYFLAIATFVLFALGVATRVTGVLTWLFVLSFLGNPITSYEGDYLLGILAFYMMIGHLLVSQFDGGLSMMERFLGSKRDFLFADRLFGAAKFERPPSRAVNWTMRLLQIHFVIIFMTSGFHKLQMGDWWSGAALWYPLHAPFDVTLDSLEREKPTAYVLLMLLSVIQYCMLAWQLALPVFAWRQGRVERTLLLGGAALGWLGAFFIFKLPLFGPFLVIGALAFLTPEEWSALRTRVQSLFAGAEASRAPRDVKKPAAALARPDIVKN